MGDWLREALFCPVHGIFAPANLLVVRMLLLGVVFPVTHWVKNLTRWRRQRKEKKDG